MSSSSQFIETLEKRELLNGADGRRSGGVRRPEEEFADRLTAADVTTILGQAASQARPGQAIVVTDREGIILGIYGTAGVGNDAGVIGFATARARTGAFFQSTENAFTTRTARFIIQDHFPHPVQNTPGGPLYGVEFSSIRGTDVLREEQSGFPAISGDPGGIPLYKNGIPVGGIGVAGDGNDVAAREDFVNTPLQLPGSNPRGKFYLGREEKDFDEAVALAGARGFEAPKPIRADRIFLDGLRAPFTKDKRAKRNPNRPLGELIAAGEGSLLTSGALRVTDPAIKASQPAPFFQIEDPNVFGVPGQLKTQFRLDSNNNLVPVPNNFADQIIDSNDTDPGSGAPLPDTQRLLESDVEGVIRAAVGRALNTRAMIRKPIGVAARVHVAVVDRDGDILGVFRMQDGTNFSYDVAVQKARTAAFFSDDQHAFTPRAVGFFSQKFFPVGIDTGNPSPNFLNQNRLSLAFPLELLNDPRAVNFDPVVAGQKNPLRNGITIFPGGAPLYKNGVLVGAVGISGDGVNEDDIIAYEGTIGGFAGGQSAGNGEGTRGYQPPPEIRSDRLPDDEIIDHVVGRIQRMVDLYDMEPLFVFRLEPGLPESALPERARQRFEEGFHDFRLPYVKFPRNPKR